MPRPKGSVNQRSKYRIGEKEYVKYEEILEDYPLLGDRAQLTRLTRGYKHEVYEDLEIETIQHTKAEKVICLLKKLHLDDQQRVKEYLDRRIEPLAAPEQPQPDN